MVPDTRLDADFAPGNGQPVVALHARFSRAATTHDVYVADVLAGRPVAGVINHEGIELLLLDGVLERPILVSLDLPELQGVRLAHDDENLNGFGHIGRFPVGIGKGMDCRSQDEGRQ